MQSRLLDLIRQGYTVVAASARLASRLRHQYATQRLAAGDSCWETPDILHWEAWVKRCHAARQLRENNGQLLIGTIQQRCLWQEIVQASSYSRDLLQITPAVDQALQAFDLCRAWGIQVFPDNLFLTRDVLAFRSWVGLYTARLDKEGWIDHAGAVQLLCEDPDAADTDRIAFYGFDELTLQQQRLIHALREHGRQVELAVPEPRITNASLLKLADPRDEIRSSALWARDILNREPDATIGIVIPNLQAIREQVETEFDQIIHPELLVTADDLPGRHYSIALGRPLSSWPLVHTALAILSLGQDTRSVNEYAALLRSPFISGTVEADARARFELELRCSGEHEWHQANLIRYAESQVHGSSRPGLFLERLKALTRAIRDVPARQSPRQWAERFSGWLLAFGWPGERPLNSSEYQQLEAWQQALNGLASLGGIIRRSTYATAISQLTQIVARTRFQPESAETPIQIAALPGAAAMQYDYLWITGMHDQVWPAPAQPNPFIPLQLQREAGLPGSSAEVVHRYTLALTESLATSARELIVSYPALDGDRECRPSPLWLRYATSAESIRAPADDYAHIIYRSARLQTLADNIAPPVVPQQQSIGGSGIFRDQAACGFRAFARHRLYAEGLAGVNIGLDAAVRGQLVHRTLHLLWQQLQTSVALHSTEVSALETIIARAVEGAIRHYQPRYPESFTLRFTGLETARLKEMARTWLQIERERPPFRVHGLEQKLTASVNGLTISLRADRIDVLADGNLVILDYKTGQVSLNHWEGERPDEPQLPLYAVSSEVQAGQQVAAIAFASLKQGKYGFSGLADNAARLPGVEAVDGLTWDEKLLEWKTVLDNLAQEFLDGQAAVAPKNSQTCRYCDLHNLCRIHELRGIVVEEDDDE